MTPRISNRALGALFIQYSGYPLWAHTGCTDTRCQVQYKFQAKVLYYFPAWLLSRMIAIQVMLTHFNESAVSLIIRAVVSSTADIFQLTHADDASGLQRLFSNRSASPNDVDILTSRSALQVSSVP